MNCKYCGSVLPEDASFCTECGKKTGNSSIRLSCAECGAPLTREGKSDILVCPYCGSKRILKKEESLLRSQLRANRARKTLKQEDQEKRQAETEKRRQAYKHSWGKRFTLLGLFVCLLMAVVSFSDDRSEAATIALVQAGLLFLSWLMGSQIIPTKNDSVKSIPKVLSIILIVPFLMCWESGFDLPKHDPWPKEGIVTRIPVPESLGTSCEVGRNTVGNVNVRLSGIKGDAVRKYIGQCKEAGFTLDPFNRDSIYRAFDEEGYGLTVLWYDSIEKMVVELEAPIEMTAFTWPDRAPYNLLPTPECTRAKVGTERENRLDVILGDFDREAFNAYVNLCVENGFGTDYRRTEDDFYCDNGKGVDLKVEYLGMGRMCIQLYKRSVTE